jgi:hypothetical protein
MIADHKAATNLWRKNLILRRQISVRSRTPALPAMTGMYRCHAAAQIIKPNVFKPGFPHHCGKCLLIRKL